MQSAARVHWPVSMLQVMMMFGKHCMPAQVTDSSLLLMWQAAHLQRLWNHLGTSPSTARADRA